MRLPPAPVPTSYRRHLHASSSPLGRRDAPAVTQAVAAALAEGTRGPGRSQAALQWGRKLHSRQPPSPQSCCGCPAAGPTPGHPGSRACLWSTAGASSLRLFCGASTASVGSRLGLGTMQNRQFILPGRGTWRATFAPPSLILGNLRRLRDGSWENIGPIFEKGLPGCKDARLRTAEYEEIPDAAQMRDQAHACNTVLATA